MSIRSLPMPRIIARPSCGSDAKPLGSPLLHHRAHPPDRAVEAAEDRLADQEMADIELDDRRYRRNRAHRLEAQPVTGVTFEAEFLRENSRGDHALQLLHAPR